MEYCPYCGRNDVPEHHKYPDRCLECGKDYHKYKSYQSQQRKSPTAKRQVLLDRIIEDYKLRKQAGLKVPKDIE